MKFYYTTGSTFENDELPQRLGAFTTFHAAQSAARQLLITEPSGIIYLYVPASNCNAATLPLEFTGWRARYCLVRIVTSLAPRRKGTPFLFGRASLIDELKTENMTDIRSALEKASFHMDRDSFPDSHDAEPILSLA